MPANRRAAKFLLVILFATAAIAISYSIYENRAWSIPPEAKLRQNPVSPTPAALAAARPIYRDKCANCHGDSGKGDGPDAASYYPRPASLADPSRMHPRSDGEVFYQITEGRKPMPAFKKRLTDEQRWQLVLLVRTFSASNAAAP